jgi:hypothetical protein
MKKEKKIKIRIPVPPPGGVHKDKSKYTRKKKHKCPTVDKGETDGN